ncbi:peroxiredoxin family protein [Nonomuraea sp. M3C6]|uniref:Peroxiredoxin family protein n=1 Tax=Nonomuraea marmarensis TaxID=3351344 RepID=A0ABW7AU75_9ACTN
MSEKTTTARRKQHLAQVRSKQTRQRRLRVIALATVALAVLLGALFTVWRGTSTPTDGTPAAGGGVRGSGEYPYQVGRPGIGQAAPAFALPATTGKKVSLADYRGKNVLLYFQEGLMCEPCWDQIGDLEKNVSAVKAAGIDQIVSITVDPIDLITRKMHDEGYTTTVLSDPDLSATKAYDANAYGMMGDSKPGHSFILVGPDGKIRWRADYGGEPKYTMFLPTSQILADMKKDTTAK